MIISLRIAMSAIVFVLSTAAQPENEQIDEICNNEEDGCIYLDRSREHAAERAQKVVAEELRRRQAAFAARVTAQHNIHKHFSSESAEPSQKPHDVKDNEASASSGTLEYAAHEWAAELESEAAVEREVLAAAGIPAFTEIGVTVVIPDGLSEGQV